MSYTHQAKELDFLDDIEDDFRQKELWMRQCEQSFLDRYSE